MDLVSFRTNVNLSFKTTVNSSYDYEFGTILGLLDSVRFWFNTINRGALKVLCIACLACKIHV